MEKKRKSLREAKAKQAVKRRRARKRKRFFVLFIEILILLILLTLGYIIHEYGTINLNVLEEFYKVIIGNA